MDDFRHVRNACHLMKLATVNLIEPIARYDDPAKTKETLELAFERLIDAAHTIIDYHNGDASCLCKAQFRDMLDDAFHPAIVAAEERPSDERDDFSEHNTMNTRVQGIASRAPVLGRV